MIIPEHITLSLILSRCKECADCGAMTHYVGGKEDRGPTIDITVDGVRKKVFVRRVVWQLMHPKGRMPSGKTVVITSRCRNHRCVSPALIHQASKSQAWVRAAAFGKRNTTAVMLKTMATRRARSKLPEEGVEDIRNSEEHPQALAAKWGISEAYVYMLKKNQFRKPISTPFAGLLA